MRLLRVAKLKSKAFSNKTILLALNIIPENHRGRCLAIVSCDLWIGKVYDDFLLQEYFLRNGVRAEIVSWQDSSVEWGKFDGAIIGSMWGYQNHLKEFEDWLSKVEACNLKIVNSADIIRKNCNKSQQIKDLRKANLPVLNTKIVKLNGILDINPPNEKFVIKPAISGSGENVFLVNGRADFEKIENKLAIINKKRELLLQPYAPEIVNGEIGIVIIGGKIMYAVRRFPGVLFGKFNVQLINEVQPELAKLAKKAWSLYPEAIYMRVDALQTKNNYEIMEVEAFEPQLYYYLLDRNKRNVVLGEIFDAVMKYINR